jgi:hypothetical protein
LISFFYLFYSAQQRNESTPFEKLDEALSPGKCSPVEAGTASQRWILAGEQYGLLTHIATTENVSLRTPMKS